jgi:alanine racemase
MVKPESNFSAIITHELEPEIYSIKGLNAFLKIAEAKKLNISYIWLQNIV